MKRVFILGADGFIGRNLAEYLAATGHAVVAATRRPAHFDHREIESKVSAFTHRDDFMLLHSCDTVIHAASSSTPGSSAAQPQLDGNLRPTLALIEALQQPPKPRVVYLSSGGTLYGETVSAVSESAPLQPSSYHAAGKIAAEYFLRAWATRYSGDLVILRPSNVYGPGQLPRPGFGIIPTAFASAITGTPMHVLGDGSSIRDYLYIGDLLRLCNRIVHKSPEAAVQVLNASSGVGITLDALLDAIDRVTGHPVSRMYGPKRAIDLACVRLDNTAARRMYRWRPRTPIEEGLAKTWAWQQQA